MPGVDLRERGDTDRRHPWETARARFFRSLIARHMRIDGRRRVLDVGAGDGWFASELGRAAADAAIVCWDVNYRSADIDVDLPVGVERTATEPEGTFDLVLLLDVLEHIEDDAAFLDRSILSHVAGDGVVIISVPAYQALFSSHDDALAHHRRYSPRRLRALLEPRFEIVARGGLFATLLPARAVSVAREHVAGARDGGTQGIGHWDRGTVVTRAVAAALALDAGAGRWLSYHGAPTPGLSTWAVCRPRSRSAR
jgi:SAM-dependent methyltransferase